jgi:DNA invertase Pin-like site-specific DNA recombinase
MTTVGYVRVSTGKQTTDQQRDALEAFGCERIFEDVASGARIDRPGLAALLDHVRPGDTVV